MTTKSLSILTGIIFLAVGLLGFTDNPIIGAGHHALFHTDGLHNAVHLISGALFLFFAFARTESVSIFMKVFGAVYFILGVLGFLVFGMDGEGKLLGFLHVNGADNFLHMGLGLLIFLFSLAPNTVKRPIAHVSKAP